MTRSDQSSSFWKTRLLPLEDASALGASVSSRYAMSNVPSFRARVMTPVSHATWTRQTAGAHAVRNAKPPAPRNAAQRNETSANQRTACRSTLRAHRSGRGGRGQRLDKTVRLARDTRTRARATTPADGSASRARRSTDHGVRAGPRRVRRTTPNTRTPQQPKPQTAHTHTHIHARAYTHTQARRGHVKGGGGGSPCGRGGGS